MKVVYSVYFDGPSGVYYDVARDELFLLFKTDTAMTIKRGVVKYYPRFDVEFVGGDIRKAVVIVDGHDFPFIGEF